MSSGDILVQAAGVSKKFSRDLRKAMTYGLADVVRSAVGSSAKRHVLRPTEFWAVRGVSLELRRGEALGVIGRNGSGKSTLLSLLNGIYMPDEGSIELRGRVGALIQLGAGFHPLLSGRENILVNAAVLGMGTQEVSKKIDAIVEFAGVEEFIDAPVRTYSSGMFARLGFSVAVHTDPAVLLVDEVLSVGDAEFRVRAMERMWQMRDRGVAVVFVSHNILSVTSFCERLLLMEMGVPSMGSMSELVSRYYGGSPDERYKHVLPEMRAQIEHRRYVVPEFVSDDVEITSVELRDIAGQPCAVFTPQQTLRVAVGVRLRRRLTGILASIELHDPTGLIIWTERSWSHGPLALEGENRLEVLLHPLQLKTGKYLLCVSFSDWSLEGVMAADGGVAFEVVDEQPNPGGNDGFYIPCLSWSIEGKALPVREWLPEEAPVGVADGARATPGNQARR